MKKILSVFIVFCFANSLSASWIVKNKTYNGNARDYKIYVPTNLQSNAKVVVLLHGLGGTMNDFDLTNWTAMADTANIILISPQGLPFSSPVGTIAGCFNSGMVAHAPIIGALPVNGNVDDVGFIRNLIDEVKNDYSVDKTRVYVTGFSNGGFMTQRLACEAADVLAAVASVSGTRSDELTSCVMGTKLPMAHFHGTADTVVYWNGYVSSGAIGEQLGISVDSLMNWWKASDLTSFAPDYTDTIGLTANPRYIIHHEYWDALGESTVELFKIVNGDHNYWYTVPTDGFDISVETWEFFNQFANEAVSIAENNTEKFKLYPNPVNANLVIEGNLKNVKQINIINALGQPVLKFNDFNSNIDMSSLQSGVYMVQIVADNGAIEMKRVLKK